MTDAAARLVSLRMYDLPGLRGHVEALASALGRHLHTVPDVAWDGDLTGQWVDPCLLLGQTCSWPLATTLRDRVRVVGAFSHPDGSDPGPDGTGDAAGGEPRYRSVIVARRPGPLEELAGGVAAISEWTSTSGWLSLAWALAHEGGSARPRDVVVSGSHAASMDLVSDGIADVASIDSVTYELHRRHRPETVADLVVVARGPAVPTLPLVTIGGSVDGLRAALAEVSADPAMRPHTEALLLDRFHPVGLGSFTGVLALAPTATAVLAPPT